MAWSKAWLKHIDPQKVTLYPLQLANCDRLENNKAVYIFDEVGSGKTISAGLMALHYLYHYFYECKHSEQRKILVITTSQLADNKDGPGPFRRIWFNKLPFSELLGTVQLKVINYDYRNIQKVNRYIPNRGSNRIKDNWDLVIIDEAHMFLRSDMAKDNPKYDTERYKELIGQGEKGGRIYAQKVVFLTATPIKNSLKDLNTYSDLAWKLTHPSNRYYNDLGYICFNNVQHNPRAILFPEHQMGEGKPENLICATFDPTRPFTRYFKDTIRDLNLSDPGDSYPRRLLAKAWVCGPEPCPQTALGEIQKDALESRQNVVLKEINTLYEESPEKNRFLIFVRWVSKNSIEPGCSAEELEDFFISHGFAKYGKSHSEEKTVEIVTGRSGKTLSSYSDPDPAKLPTVLIVNYQIGQQGVNLPGYNHIINYHIPASPAALEQRFGRIDRLDSTAKKICVFFPLLESFPDNSTFNFYCALSAYVQQHLPALPCRNSILTEEMLELFRKNREKLQEEASEIKDTCNQWKSDMPWEKILKYLDKLDQPGVVAGEDLTPEERKVAKFIAATDKTIDRGLSEAKRIMRIKNIKDSHLEKMTASTEASEETIEHWKELIKRSADSECDDEIGNKIFYINDSFPEETPLNQAMIDRLKIVSPVGDDGCAGYIRKLPGYQDYKKQIQDELGKESP